MIYYCGAKLAPTFFCEDIMFKTMHERSIHVSAHDDFVRSDGSNGFQHFFLPEPWIIYFRSILSMPERDGMIRLMQSLITWNTPYVIHARPADPVTTIESSSQATS